MLSSVALYVLTIPHINAAEECVFSMIKENKTTFRSSLDLKTSLNSIMITKMNTPEHLELLKNCKTACKDYNKQLSKAN